MAENYTPQEALEHVEHSHELLSRSEVAVLRFVPLLAAILAIFAGLSSLYSARLGEAALGLKNEALLSEVKASDAWTEYQAESIKAHLYEAGAQAGAGVKTASGFRANAATYRREQIPLRTVARQQEAERDMALQRSAATEARKANFDIALALFEVSIVLTSIAAMIKRQPLFILAGVGGLIGLIFSLLGIFYGRL